MSVIPTRTAKRLAMKYSVHELRQLQNGISAGIDRAYNYTGSEISKTKMQATIRGLKKRYHTLDQAIRERKVLDGIRRIIQEGEFLA